jgi:transglutaminase-like putative cysteine protease
MSLGERLSKRLLACVILALLAFATAEESIEAAIIVGGLGFTGWWLNERRHHRLNAMPLALPRWLSSLLALTSVGAAIFRGYTSPYVASAFLWLIASVLVLKVWERRQPRDYWQLFTLAVFLSIGATLSTNSIVLAIVLLLQVPVAVSGVVTYQLYNAIATASGVSAASALVLSPRASQSLKHISRFAIVFGAVATVIAFLFIPRGIGLRRFGDFAQPLAGRTTGFVDRVDLDQSGLISTSQTPVMDVRLMNMSRRALPITQEPLYLRGAVLDEYTGREWVRGNENEVGAEVYKLTTGSASNELALSHRVWADPDSVIQVIRIRQAPRGEVPFFCLWRPRFLRVSGNADVHFERDTARLWKTGESGNFEYEVKSQPADGEDVKLERSRRGGKLIDSPAVAKLAVEVLREAGIEPDPQVRAVQDDERAALALTFWLRKRCEYTLETPAVPLKTDPIEFFLYQSKRGSCEHFASGLAALCRSVGIDARVIAGYLASEQDPDTGLYTVRQSNAHAWCEVNIAPGVWKVCDATPPSFFEDARNNSRSVLTRLSQAMADLRDRWNLSIVAFDASSQQHLLGVSDRDQHWVVVLTDFISRGMDADQARGSLVARKIGRWLAYGAGTSAVLGTLFVAVSWIRRRKHRPRIRNAGWALMPSSQCKRLQKALNSAFRELGNPRPAWRSLRDHARTVAGDDTELADALAAVADLLNASSFGLVAEPTAPVSDVAISRLRGCLSRRR